MLAYLGSDESPLPGLVSHLDAVSSHGRERGTEGSGEGERSSYVSPYEDTNPFIRASLESLTSKHHCVGVQDSSVLVWGHTLSVRSERIEGFDWSWF